MSSSSVADQVEVILEKQEIKSDSSADPPMEEWSSLLGSAESVVCQKREDYQLGLYNPGSGEICAKYITQSDSSVLRHVYYNYPSIKDPGIMQALTLSEPKYTYDSCGQELYLDVCKEIGVAPIKIFHRGLTESEIDLKYYGVNPSGVRAMSLALALNRFVTRLDLTSNFLDNDACYHLGQLLKDNTCLNQLVLAQCKIGPSGMKRIAAHLHLRTMELLDLSKNELKGEGFAHLAAAILNGGIIKRLNLSHNELSAPSGIAFVEAIESNNTITHLDLSWNNFFQPSGSNRIFNMLSYNKYLTELNFSWNNLTTTLPLNKILTCKNLRILDLSNNRLGRKSCRVLAKNLPKAKKLHTLDLSSNPFEPEDAVKILEKLMDKNVRLENLFMTEVLVNKKFAYLLQGVKALPFRQNLVITHGCVVHDYSLSFADMREIVMKRLDYVGSKGGKKHRVDLCMLLMQEQKERGHADFITPAELTRAVKVAGGNVDEGLMEELGKLFPGPNLEKGGKTIKLGTAVEYINRLWPDKRLPPTPEPEPEPEPPPPTKGDKGKGDKGKGDKGKGDKGKGDKGKGDKGKKKK